jgi:hypothetical protein
MKSSILTGRKQIQNFVGRDWRLIVRWVEIKEFPARKIDGVWESDAALIETWRRAQIKSCQQ